MNTGIVLSQIPFALALFLLLPTGRLSSAGRLAVLAGAVLLLMIPVDGLSLAEYARSLTNDLSIATLLWLAWSAGARIASTTGQSERRHLQLALCFASLALLLYPASLGLSMFDPYRLGYAPGYLLVLVFVVSVALWLVRHYFGAALFTAVTLVFLLDFRSPENYWDYLIDPLLGLYCLGFIGVYLLRRARGGMKARIDRISSRPVTGPAFESPGKRLVTTMTNLCVEEGVKNTE